jgi:hypothetical protein
MLATRTIESGKESSVTAGDRMAFRVWLTCGAILWLLGLVNWLTGLWSH